MDAVNVARASPALVLERGTFMVRAAFSMVALVLVATGALAADRKANRPELDAQGNPIVIVDPMDLRQPVPNPEAELTQKYNNHTVRYTGRLVAIKQDQKSKIVTYQVQSEVRQPKQPSKNAKAAQPKPAIVTVVVFPQQDNQRLHNARITFDLTVQGKGEVMTDGTLWIRNAQIKSITEATK